MDFYFYLYLVTEIRLQSIEPTTLTVLHCFVCIHKDMENNHKIGCFLFFVVFISTVHARVCSMDFLLSRVERGNDNVVVCLLFRFGLCSQHKRSLQYFVLSISRTDLKQIVLPLCFGSNIWLSQAFRMTFISNL